MARPNNIVICSFCGKTAADVKKLIAGPGVYICDNCIKLYYGVLMGCFDKSARCSFCGKTQAEVNMLVPGGRAHICDQCITLCKKVLDKELALAMQKSPDSFPQPKTKITLCSFCGKSIAEVENLIRGPGVYICDNCIKLCKSVLDKELAREAGQFPPSSARLKLAARPNKIMLCSFCGRTAAESRKLIRSQGVCICDHCITLCNGLLDKKMSAKTGESSDNSVPKELIEL